MLNVQEDVDEDDDELEDELLDCLMCRNETLVDFLRKHIKFHHMIQVIKLHVWKHILKPLLAWGINLGIC